MALQLDKVVPFGRSFDEYVKMFSLTEADLQKSILGVADGPASFNAEGTERGYRIHSIDPLYEFGGLEIRERFYAVLDDVIRQVIASEGDWVWRYHSSPAELKARRVAACEQFCADYAQGKQQGRYATGNLPTLEAVDGSYDVGLCSHFLFLYSSQCDTDFHMAAMDEMLRVCKEVRVFPLLSLDGKKSPHLASVLEHLQQSGHTCTVETVEYEFQRGGNQMLRVV